MCLRMTNLKSRFESLIGRFHLQNANNAMYAGFFGSAASVFGKLITYFDLENMTWENTTTTDLNVSSLYDDQIDNRLKLFLVDFSRLYFVSGHIDWHLWQRW